MWAEFFTHPGVVGILVALPSLGIAYLGYLKGKRSDDLALITAAITSPNRSAKIIAGQGMLISNLQEDNRILRERLDEYEEQLRGRL